MRRCGVWIALVGFGYLYAYFCVHTYMYVQSCVYRVVVWAYGNWKKRVAMMAMLVANTRQMEYWFAVLQGVGRGC